jgi:hypothetical protein
LLPYYQRGFTQAVKASKLTENEEEESASNEMLALAYLHSESVLLARRCSKKALQINSDLDTAMAVYKATKLIMSTQQVDFGEKTYQYYRIMFSYPSIRHHISVQ